MTERARNNSCTQIGKIQQLRVSHFADLRAVIRSPFKLIGAAGGQVCLNSSPAVVCREVSPALPHSVDYHSDFTVKVSLPFTGGMILRHFSGNQTLFTSEQSRVNPLEYLGDRLTAFSQKNPDLFLQYLIVQRQCPRHEIPDLILQSKYSRIKFPKIICP